REHTAEIRTYAASLEKQQGLAGRNFEPPLLQGRARVPWSDLEIFSQGLGTILADRRDSIERRLRKCLALADLCRKAKFDKVTGQRLTELLDLLASGLDDEVPTDPASLPRPGWTGRLLFRQAVALFTRKDRGPNRGPATFG